MITLRSKLRYQRFSPSMALGFFLVVCIFSTVAAIDAAAQSLDDPGTVPFSEVQEMARVAAATGLIAAAQSDSTSASLAAATVYMVDLVVSDDLSELRGTMEAIYTHRDDQPVDEIAFHLYANGIGGQITVGSAKIGGTPAPIRLSENGTVAWVELGTALEARQAIAITLEFVAIVPSGNVSHYGILNTDGKTVSLAHILPLLAIFDGRWRVDSPPEYGDVLYADASFFVVGLDVPAGIAIAGTGVEASRASVSAGRDRVTISAGPVRELYLALMRDLSVFETETGETTIRVFAPLQLAARARQAGEEVALALESFGGWFGNYPFSELDIVVGPTRAVGMEFPGAILIGESTFAQSSLGPVSRIGGPSFFEIVLVHETAHQWFHTIVGNDQTNQPWLDESAAQYVTWQHAKARYGEVGDEAFEQWLTSTYLLAGIPEMPLALPTSAYSTSSYASVIYGKGPLFYAALEDEYGEEMVLDALREYLDAFRWRNGTLSAIRNVLESSCGCSMAPWFEAWIYGN